MSSILLIDDSLTVRMDLNEIFFKAGFHVSSCSTAAEARQVFFKETFNLIVLDILLPDGDGIDLVKEIRANALNRDTPIMLLSTEAEVCDRVRGMNQGANEYVGKPYDKNYVLARAKALINRPEARLGENVLILLIDDSLTFREALRQQIEDAGYTVVTAATGEEGLHLAVDIRPHAIIVDGQLPGMDGPSVIRHLRNDAVLRRTPCILLTSAEGKAEELRALEAGADDFVTKESSPDIILARLNVQLRSMGTPLSLSAPSLVAPKRILAVDDSATYRNELGERLREEGFEPVLAASGEDALALLKVQPVDCILLDLIMPGMSGHETCRMIKNIPEMRDIPLLILTAVEDHATLVAGFNAGADDYIVKSGDFEVLKSRMRAQLRRKQFEDENRQFRDQLVRHELDAAEARAALELAEARRFFLSDLEAKNLALAEANVRLQETHDSLLSLQRQKEDWISYVVHDLKSPLTSIMANSLFLRNMPGIDADVLSCALDLVESSKEMQRLIMNMLDISRAEEGTLALRYEPIYASQMIEEMQRRFTRRFQDKSLQAQARGATNLIINADRDIIRRVLENILDNAIKNSPRGSSIFLECQNDAGWNQIRIGDEGYGIPDELRHQVFDKYVQLSGAPAPRIAGRGLGLAFCRIAIEAHGGKIWVESNAPQGSVFCVALPEPGALHPVSAH